MRYAIGLSLNAAAFILAVLCQWPIAAAVVYIASVALLLPTAQRKRAEERPPAEAKREPTPDEIKRRPVSAPEI
ncbi:hypothetical protein [Pyrobaculum neutrophilum]|uniref:Uncharacterized protein n=1 Tax=Pyrobaculum neutrophilum (strain DSM 2338 / JCM 9278 / NBRC 100436 / V24Sta) TaxID=444157 RepID=B1YAY9_PYRNV|nr:hypothetical protein [Pyrobaculum neutrophilum]ACB40689.1 conserved hypothetical protein [Pyrobaculum neutrophilum V24Sta]